MTTSYVSSKNGKRARGRTRAGTDIWWLGLSVCGSMIGIRRSDGSKVGMTSTQDLFWNETCSTNGTRVIAVRVGNE
jgi:hypothetical protein